jgi:8-oxo-dGTP diphosphatase
VSYTYEYPRPAVSADIALVYQKKSILLIRRLNDPYKDCWALPGGFMDMDETLMECAYRELNEETNLQGIDLQQFKTYDAIGRDPRARVLTTVFVGFTMQLHKSQLKAADDASDYRWCDLKNLPELAFDHQLIIEDIRNCFKL